MLVAAKLLSDTNKNKQLDAKMSELSNSCQTAISTTDSQNLLSPKKGEHFSIQVLGHEHGKFMLDFILVLGGWDRIGRGRARHHRTCADVVYAVPQKSAAETACVPHYPEKCGEIFGSMFDSHECFCGCWWLSCVLVVVAGDSVARPACNTTHGVVFCPHRDFHGTP
jgi:hypothetical protein